MSLFHIMFEFLLFYSSSFSFRSLLLARRRIPHSIRSQTIRKQWKWLYSDIRDPANSFFISLSLFALWVYVLIAICLKRRQKRNDRFWFWLREERSSLNSFSIWCMVLWLHGCTIWKSAHSTILSDLYDFWVFSKLNINFRIFFWRREYLKKK